MGKQQRRYLVEVTRRATGGTYGRGEESRTVTVWASSEYEAAREAIFETSFGGTETQVTPL